MALQLTGNNSQYWYRPVNSSRSQLTTPSGVSMMAWVLSTGTPTKDITDLVSLGSSRFQSESAIQFENAYANKVPCLYEWEDDGGDDYIVSPFLECIAPNVWTCIIVLLKPDGTNGLYLSTFPNQVYSSDAPVTGTLTYDSLFVGYQSKYSIGKSLNTFQIAELTIWNTLLDQTTALNLFSGSNPLTILPGNVLFYYPLRNDYRDYGPTYVDLIPVGGATAVFTPHPPILSGVDNSSLLTNLSEVIVDNSSNPIQVNV